MRIRLLVLALLVLLPTMACATGTYLDFNDFPVTNAAPGSVPGDSPTWAYSSGVTNNYPDNVESFGAGWLTKTVLSDGQHWLYTTAQDRMDYCSGQHSGDVFGYLDITSSGHTGNALRQVVTGGRPEGPTDHPCPNPALGTRLYNKESYTNTNQIYTGGKVGASYFQVKRVTGTGAGAQRVMTPFSIATNANRMSVYAYLPASATNWDGSFLSQTFQWGIFVDPNYPGSHHYFNFLTRGGGWTKMQVEETTNGDNGDNGATRYIPNLLHTAWQFYFASLPYTGLAIPPYEVRYDDIAFENDTYTPQNNETISNIAVLYRDSDKTWEISFNDKYKNSYSYSTYQVKYSTTAPITNENWGAATPVNVIADSHNHIDARSDGKFQKYTPDLQGVWAPFALSTGDTNSLAAGQTVYFAIKDISQSGNTQTPNNTIITTGYPYDQAGRGGRDYAGHPSNFDWANDQAAIPNVKRISYTLASTVTSPPPTPTTRSLNGRLSGSWH